MHFCGRIPALALAFMLAAAIAFAQGGWQSQDIGNTIAGSTNINGGVFTIEGNGNDIWDQADGFRFVYLIGAGGDCELQARVTSQEPTDGWAKAGVMIREALDAGSKHAFMCQTIGNGQAFQSRTSTNAGSNNNHNGQVTAPPVWVRIKRTGNTFYGYYAPDNGGRPGSWVQQGDVQIDMPAVVHVGLAVTSHAYGNLCTAVFDNVATTGTRKAGAGFIIGRPAPPRAPASPPTTLARLQSALRPALPVALWRRNLPGDGRQTLDPGLWTIDQRL